MRRRLIIAPEAELDLDGLAAFIAEDSLETAVRLYEAAESVFQHLLSMPEIGATRDLGLNRLDGLRMWPIPDFPNHLIFYRPTDAGVEIVRVLHAARDIPGIFEEERPSRP